MAEQPQQQPGFEIKGRFYPFPASFRLGDPVLVSEVTGLDWPTFTARLDDPAYDEDLVVLSGMIAVAVWQKHPTWRRDRVARYIESLDMDRLSFVGPTDQDDEEDEEADDGPPDLTAAEAAEKNSETSPTSSSATPASPSEPSSPSSSGPLASDTGSPASPQDG